VIYIFCLAKSGRWQNDSPGQNISGLFWEVMGLMKKAKNAIKKKTANTSALQGVHTHNPHEDFAKHDADFKKSRGAQR
jgi:hypothetical protein